MDGFVWTSLIGRQLAYLYGRLALCFRVNDTARSTFESIVWLSISWCWRLLGSMFVQPSRFMMLLLWVSSSSFKGVFDGFARGGLKVIFSTLGAGIGTFHLYVDTTVLNSRIE